MNMASLQGQQKQQQPEPSSLSSQRRDFEPSSSTQQQQHLQEDYVGSTTATVAETTETQDQQQDQQQSPPETSEIKRLDDSTIRRISAEQAISDLASIVKELIDNSLDAESTTIKGPFDKFTYLSSKCCDLYAFPRTPADSVLPFSLRKRSAFVWTGLRYN